MRSYGLLILLKISSLPNIKYIECAEAVPSDTTNLEKEFKDLFTKLVFKPQLKYTRFTSISSNQNDNRNDSQIDKYKHYQSYMQKYTHNYFLNYPKSPYVID